MENLHSLALRLVVVALLSSVAVVGRAAPSPHLGVIVENFDLTPAPPMIVLDDRFVGETITRPQGVGFAWGAYSASVGIDAVFFGPLTYSYWSPAPPAWREELNGLSICGDAWRPGSYAYTRFDVIGTDGANNTPADALNMSNAGARIVIRTAQSGATGVALLLRASGVWWQSDSKTLPTTADWATPQTPSGQTTLADTEYALTGAGAVAWTAVTNTTDLEQVDAGGEGPLGLGAQGTPNFSNVDGVGVMITSGAAIRSDFAGITVTRIQLEAPPLPTAARNWTLFR